MSYVEFIIYNSDFAIFFDLNYSVAHLDCGIIKKINLYKCALFPVPA